MDYFSRVVITREFFYGSNDKIVYSVVAPTAVMQIVLITAGSCISYAETAPKISGVFPDFVAILKGLICGLAVMITGIFAVIEYLLAFLEFMLVTSVGIILFPLSLWEGTKFMAEKLIGAIMGFFIKLLFSNICIFLLLFGYMSLIRGPAFSGKPDEILVLLFISILFFYICKSAPGLAQSLLTGTPSLSAAGAIGAVGGAIAGAAGAFGMAKAAGGAVAGGVAKTAFAGAGAVSQAMGAAEAVKTLGGGGMQQASAFVTSMGKSAKEAALSTGSDLARSLTGNKSGGKAGGGPGSPGGGLNRHSRSQAFQNATDADGNRQSYKEYFAARKAEGVNDGENQMANSEKSRNLVKEYKEQNKND
jgi:type IV secretion system protein TrbL